MANRMAQRVKVPATEPDNLRSILVTHTLEGENSYKLFSDSHICALTHILSFSLDTVNKKN